MQGLVGDGDTVACATTSDELAGLCRALGRESIALALAPTPAWLPPWLAQRPLDCSQACATACRTRAARSRPRTRRSGRTHCEPACDRWDNLPCARREEQCLRLHSTCGCAGDDEPCLQDCDTRCLKAVQYVGCDDGPDLGEAED